MAAESGKVLVTTATGNVGSKVVAQLLEQKVPVRAAVRDSTTDKAMQLAGLGAEVVNVDIEDTKSLDAALEGCSKVVFISPMSAAHQAVTDAWMEAIQRNKSDIKFLVRLSALGTADPKSLIHKWHALTEVLLKATEIPCCFVRPGVFVQSIAAVIAPAIKSGSSYTYPLNETKLVYIDCRDVARVIVKALTSTDGAYNERVIELKGPQALSQPELAAIVSKAAEKPVEYIPVTVQQQHEMMIKLGYPDVMADMISEFFSTVIDEEEGVQYRTPDDSVQKETGQPALTVEQFVQEHVHLFK